MNIVQLPLNAFIVQITGGREWTNKEAVYRELSALSANTAIIHGDCRGADRLSDEVAKELGFPSVACPAHWNHDDRNWVRVHGNCPDTCRQIVGKAAGVLRNIWMLDTYKADLVLAFHENLAKSKGTAHMVKEVQTRHIPIKVISE